MMNYTAKQETTNLEEAKATTFYTVATAKMNYTSELATAMTRFLQATAMIH